MCPPILDVLTAANAQHPWDGKEETFKQVWHFRSKLGNNCELIMMLTFCPAFPFCSQGRGFLFHLLEPNSCSGAVRAGETPQSWGGL